MDSRDLTVAVKNYALQLGFDACGFAKAEFLETEARRLEEWLVQQRHGTMSWMEKNFDKRVDPTKLVPGAKSVVSVIGSYFHPEHDHNNANSPKIAKYALGRDYHKVFKNKLKELFLFTESLVGKIEGRFFVDSAPVLDKAWAVRSGLGWMGKNSNILNKEIGSFFFIGEMIIDVDFNYSSKTTDHCGTCTKCIDACPTNAIYEPYRVDSNKCISYLTIELKDQIPEELQSTLGEWMYGCDICQDVCPWNKNSSITNMGDFKPRQKLLHKNIDFWSEIDNPQYDELFEGSAIRRAKFEKFKMNTKIVETNLRRS
ncbi:MAG TPA: tRNA epoxyqueuosine(34) reductase QueG [Balneola sp.]|nr:tRNA epoxyqueuosine(34) reductase QueG [Balneola sp.]